MIAPQVQLECRYATGARRVKIVCWPPEDECDRCRGFRGAAVDARTAIRRELIPPPNCRTPTRCGLRYPPLVDDTSVDLGEAHTSDGSG